MATIVKPIRADDPSGVKFKSYQTGDTDNPVVQAVALCDPDQTGGDIFPGIVDQNGEPSAKKSLLTQACPSIKAFANALGTTGTPITFDNVTLASNGSDVTGLANFRHFHLAIRWATINGETLSNAINVRLIPQFKIGTDYFDFVEMPFGDLRHSMDSIAEGVTTGVQKFEIVHGPVLSTAMRIRGVAVGTLAAQRIQVWAQLGFSN